jgi:hypothetical protein
MVTRATIHVSTDEHQARFELIAWLAYPSNDRLRHRARKYLREYACFRSGLRITTRPERLESALHAIDRNLDYHFMAGEIFRGQIFDAVGEMQNHPAMFRQLSTKKISRIWANQKISGDERNIRRALASASPILHLAVGACDGLTARPALLTQSHPGLTENVIHEAPGLLLNDTRYWTQNAIRVASEIAEHAKWTNHRREKHLAALSVFDLPPA